MAEFPPGGPGPRAAFAPLVVVAGLALLASLTGLGNGFTYDDVHLIVQNGRVHGLLSLPLRLAETYWPEVPLVGEGRLYRPFTVIGFTLQWALGRGAPVVFHVTSTLLYLLVSLLVYALARRLLPMRQAALAAALFAVHPVHVEAVANVVGQGELLATGFLLLGTILYLDGRALGFSRHRIGAIAASYGAALLCKENAAFFPLLLATLEPALPTATRDRAKVLLTPLVLTAAIWLAIRFLVTGSLSGEYPHAAWIGMAWPLRALTMLGVVWVWTRLLLWPAALSADYSPQEVPIADGLGPLQFAGVSALAVALYFGLRFRRLAPVVAAGLLWVAVALIPVSNLLAPTGIVAAERTLFLPSVGLVLAVAGLVELWARGPRSLLGRRLAGAIFLTLLGLGVWKSAARHPVWKDNSTLFARTIVDAPRSYWAWRNYAGDMVLKGREPEARSAYEQALTLFDRDPQLLDDRASFERRTGHCDRAVDYFRMALALDPGRHMTAARLIGCLSALGRFDEARGVANDRIERGRGEFETIRAMVDRAEAAAHLPDSATPIRPTPVPVQP